MNGTVLNKTELAAWRSLLARPEQGNLWLSAGIYLFASLILPFAGEASLCILFIGACVAFLLTRTHTFRTVLAPGIPALALFSLSGSMLPAAIYFALLFGAATGAILLLSARNMREGLLLIGLPLSAFLITWLISGNPLIALLALIPLPLALICALVVRRCKPFTAAIAAIGTVLVGVLMAVAIMAVVATNPQYFDLIHHIPALAAELLSESVSKAVNEVAALYPEMAITAIFTPTMIHNMIALMINLSPGILIAACLIVSYFIWRTLCTLLVALGMLPRLPRVFAMPITSVVSAILFILAFLVAFFAGSAYTLVGAVAENFALILTPVFSLIGFGALFGRGAQRSCLSVLLLIGMAYLLFNNPPLALTFAALYGAIHALIFAYQNAKNPHNKKGEP